MVDCDAQPDRFAAEIAPDGIDAELRKKLNIGGSKAEVPEVPASGPAEAKEAAAFALLAWQTWHHLPGNVPRATGALRPVILGQVTYA